MTDQHAPNGLGDSPEAASTSSDSASVGQASTDDAIRSGRTTVPGRRGVLYWLRRMIRTVGCLLLTYVVVIGFGLIPVNTGFEPAGEDGVTIYVVSNAVHADIIVPLVTPVMDWRQEFPEDHFVAKRSVFSHVAIGWGDRGFFLNTPRWEDLRMGTAVNAILLPSDSVMHVQFTSPRESEMCRAVRITPDAYQKLVDYILASFAGTRETRQRFEMSYNSQDCFYPARGRYHLFNTCNCWVGRGLKRCGVKVPSFSPLPRTVFWYLPEMSP